IESLACGTPVVATRRGAVPEVLEDGRTGIIVDDHSELAAAIPEADRIDPAECRRAVEERFSPRVLLASYLRGKHERRRPLERPVRWERVGSPDPATPPRCCSSSITF